MNDEFRLLYKYFEIEKERRGVREYDAKGETIDGR